MTVLLAASFLFAGCTELQGGSSAADQQKITQLTKDVKTLESKNDKCADDLKKCKEGAVPGDCPPCDDCPAGGVGGEPGCDLCHANVDTFHNIKMVKAIDQQKGADVRECTFCHGAEKAVHTIHENALASAKMSCQTCHMSDGGDFRIPAKRPQDTLVCELCHFDGKYIPIHKSKCERCHPTDLVDIHSPALSNRVNEIAALAR